jgi:hypothetical protein
MINVYASLGAPEDINVDAWAAYLRAVRDSLNAQWARTKSAYFTLKEIREQFGLSFIIDQAGEATAPPGAWTTALQNKMLKLQSIVDVLNLVATDALEDKRKLAWNPQRQDFEIEKLPVDPLTVQLVNGQPELVDNSGAVIQPTGDVGVGLAPLAWVAIVGVVAIAVYFSTESVCDTIEKTAEQKTMQTIGDQSAKLVEQGKATPEEAAAMTSAVYKGAAEVKKAEAVAEAAKGKPASDIANTVRTLGFVALSVGVLYLAATVIGRMPAGRALARAA